MLARYWSSAVLEGQFRRISGVSHWLVWTKISHGEMQLIISQIGRRLQNDRLSEKKILSGVTQ